MTRSPDRPQEDMKAQQLASLEVKRARTLSDLEAVQAAAASIQRSTAAYQGRQNALHAEFSAQIERDDLPETERLALYRAWNAAFKTSIDEFNNLTAERERLHMQEVILVRMLAELDHQIRVLKAALA
jgi:septal ring factor EnvC (AmiA/AmiB activator)